MNLSQNMFARLYLTAALMLPLLVTAKEIGMAPVAGTAPAMPSIPLTFDKTPALPAASGGVPLPVEPGAIRLNFQQAALSDVLSYISDTTGLIIVQEVPVNGTVNVMSARGLDTEDIVDLLNAVLFDKGFAAIRSGRILKIASLSSVLKRGLPVGKGSDPMKIPRNESMVTRIMPVRYGEAARLVENLRPLLGEKAAISVNESSNSILLTDTQINIHRIALIIQALDTSVSAIASIHIFPLHFADAAKLAAVVNQLFAIEPASNSGRAAGGAAPAAPPSEARQAAGRVVGVADEQSNSLVVSAPNAMMPSISALIHKVDIAITEAASMRIFHLLHADAIETASTVTGLFSGVGAQGNSGGPALQQGGQNAESGERALNQSKIAAAADPRTNSLLITASQNDMLKISDVVWRLDSIDSKKQRAYVHQLGNADPDGMAAVLRGMLGGTSPATASDRLVQRASTGAAIDTSSTAGSGAGGR